MSSPTTEAIARIIDPSRWAVMDSYLAEMKRKLAGKNAGYDPDNFKDKASLAKAAAILAVIPPGEELLEFKEALSDLRSLRQEHRDLNGGGPNWTARNKVAWDRVDELFANEDEAADQRRIEGHYG